MNTRVHDEEDAVLLQRIVDALFRDARSVTRLDAIMKAEAYDAPADLMGVMELIPQANYSRHHLCSQLNSVLKGHGWTSRFRTVD